MLRKTVYVSAIGGGYYLPPSRVDISDSDHSHRGPLTPWSPTRTNWRHIDLRI